MKHITQWLTKTSQHFWVISTKGQIYGLNESQMIHCIIHLNFRQKIFTALDLMPNWNTKSPTSFGTNSCECDLKKVNIGKEIRVRLHFRISFNNSIEFRLLRPFEIVFSSNTGSPSLFWNALVHMILLFCIKCWHTLPFGDSRSKLSEWVPKEWGIAQIFFLSLSFMSNV